MGRRIKVDVVGLYLDCAALAVDTIGDVSVARAWSNSSALSHYDVAGLAGHLARAVLATEEYFDQGRVDTPDAELLDASAYFAEVLGEHDPLVSSVHRQIRDRSYRAAQRGHAELTAGVAAALGRLRETLPGVPPGRTLVVLDGVNISAAEYLKTRIVELVVHIDDLAVSVDRPTPPIPEPALVMVAGILGELAARQHGGLRTVRGLARRERQPGGIHAM